MTNHLISVEGENAQGEVNLLARHIVTSTDEEEHKLDVNGIYNDRYIKVDGKWKFSSIQLLPNWIEGDPSKIFSNS